MTETADNSTSANNASQSSEDANPKGKESSSNFTDESSIQPNQDTELATPVQNSEKLVSALKKPPPPRLTGQPSLQFIGGPRPLKTGNVLQITFAGDHEKNPISQAQKSPKILTKTPQNQQTNPKMFSTLPTVSGSKLTPAGSHFTHQPFSPFSPISALSGHPGGEFYGYDVTDSQVSENNDRQIRSLRYVALALSIVTIPACPFLFACWIPAMILASLRRRSPNLYMASIGLSALIIISIVALFVLSYFIFLTIMGLGAPNPPSYYVLLDEFGQTTLPPNAPRSNMLSHAYEDVDLPAPHSGN